MVSDGRQVPLLPVVLFLLVVPTRSQDTVALIVGGFSQDAPEIEGQPQSVASAELFGCPGRGQDSYPVDDYPFRNYLSSGIYDQDGGAAVICGGYKCDQVDCEVSNECHAWTPGEQWQNHSILWQKVFDHTVAKIVNLELEPASDERFLFTIGPNRDTQVSQQTFTTKYPLPYHKCYCT